MYGMDYHMMPVYIPIVMRHALLLTFDRIIQNWIPV